MDEIIMQVARALACQTRLALLSCLARGEELSPSALAAELQLPLYVVSTQIRRLVSAGLIQQRRSGVWAYCQPRSPYGQRTFSGRVSAWVLGLLKHPDQALHHCRVVQLCNDPSPAAKVQALIFEAATAFTNVRRLQLLRHLSKGREARVDVLTGTLRMSEAAVSRHMAKLARRGYVSRTRKKKTIAFGLNKTMRTPLHDELFELVRQEWRRG